MNRRNKMILLLCVLAVLIGVYFLVQHLNNKNETVSETAGTFEMTEKTADELSGISWERLGVAYSFTKDDDIWVTANEPAWPVYQDALQDLADTLTGLKATRKLDDVKDLSDYGLTEPVFSVTATWTDGTKTTYSMGDATPFADGYYLMLSGNQGTIYTIEPSLSESFALTQKDMVQMENIPYVTQANHLTIGDALDAVKSDESRTVDPDQLWYDAASNAPLDGTQIESLAEDVNSLYWNELVSANASEEGLASWGLDEETAVRLTLTGDDNTSRVLLIGKEIDSSNYYAKLPESSMIYTIESDLIGSLLSASADDMWIKTVLPMPWESLKTAEFITEKGSFLLEKPLETDSDDSAENTEEAPAEGIDYETKPDTTLEELWTMVTGLQATDRMDTEPIGDQILSIHAVNTNEMETTLVITEYDVNNYLAVIDGGITVTVPADKVDQIIRTVRSL